MQKSEIKHATYSVNSKNQTESITYYPAHKFKGLLIISNVYCSLIHIYITADKVPALEGFTVALIGRPLKPQMVSPLGS